MPPLGTIDPKKIDELIRKDTLEAGISCLNKKDPEHLEHTYTFKNGTKTLEFVGISHLDNLKRHIKQHPLEKDNIQRRMMGFMEKLRNVIGGSGGICSFTGISKRNKYFIVRIRYVLSN